MNKNQMNSKLRYLAKIGPNERLSVLSVKWLSLTRVRFPHLTRLISTRSTSPFLALLVHAATGKAGNRKWKWKMEMENGRGKRKWKWKWIKDMENRLTKLTTLELASGRRPLAFTKTRFIVTHADRMELT